MLLPPRCLYWPEKNRNTTSPFARLQQTASNAASAAMSLLAREESQHNLSVCTPSTNCLQCCFRRDVFTGQRRIATQPLRLHAFNKLPPMLLPPRCLYWPEKNRNTTSPFARLQQTASNAA